MRGSRVEQSLQASFDSFVYIHKYVTMFLVSNEF
jgi:hypothetical protein